MKERDDNTACIVIIIFWKGDGCGEVQKAPPWELRIGKEEIYLVVEGLGMEVTLHILAID